MTIFMFKNTCKMQLAIIVLSTNISFGCCGCRLLAFFTKHIFEPSDVSDVLIGLIDLFTKSNIRI